MNLKLPELDIWTHKFLEPRLKLLDRWQKYKDSGGMAAVKIVKTATHADDLGLPRDKNGNHSLFFLELTPEEMAEVRDETITYSNPAGRYIYAVRLEEECESSTL